MQQRSGGYVSNIKINDPRELTALMAKWVARPAASASTPLSFSPVKAKYSPAQNIIKCSVSRNA